MRRRTISRNVALRLVRELDPTGNLYVGGSLDRGSEDVGDVDLYGKIDIDEFAHTAKLKGARFFEFSGNRVTFILKNVHVDYWSFDSKNFGAVQTYVTGPVQVNSFLRKVARTKGLRFSSDGLWKGDLLLETKDRHEFFERMEMRCV